jgi:post-segregation antitoxin (ccd killing protein)
LGKNVVIAVRVPAEVKEDIEKLGFEVSAFVKEAITEKLRRRRSEEAMKWIRANKVLGKEIGFDSVETLRRMRKTM